VADKGWPARLVDVLGFDWGRAEIRRQGTAFAAEQKYRLFQDQAPMPIFHHRMSRLGLASAGLE
jgi:hypothetical protein